MTTDTMVIMKGQRVQQAWRDGKPDDVLLKASPKGYINKQLFLEFGMSFIDKLQQMNLLDAPHVLMMDGHYSHLFNYAFMQLMSDNDIRVVSLPPHTTQVLQPLDVGVFSPMKHYWNKNLTTKLWSTAGQKLTKQQFWEVLAESLSQGLTVKNIQAGFRETGLYPICRVKITPEKLSTSDPIKLPDQYSDSEDEDSKLFACCFGFGFGVVTLNPVARN
jgi:hypothetical protein